jgi:CRP/FNR family cyclic AMP-dependent transcriptional regulator
MANAPLSREEMLAGHFLLRHLHPDELSRVAASARLVRYKPQMTIFQKGDPGASMMAVVTGRVKICTFSLEGKEMVLNYIDRGGLFGEIALLDGQPRSADAVAQPGNADPQRQPPDRRPGNHGTLPARTPGQ